jgi:photosystem II stability/assembly factor-like uncharacterized protein
MLQENRMKLCCLAVSLLVCASVAHAQWQQQTINSKADFRGLCAVSANVAWVSGTHGTYARTTDGGKNWKVGTVPEAAKLDFRDVKAFGQNTAYLLSAGPGEASRIYKTIDGGQTWALQFKNPDPRAFYDALAFWNEMNGIALGDPVNSRFELMATNNGGRNWTSLGGERPHRYPKVSRASLPPALPGEGAFAASGTCLVTVGGGDVWFGTGGAQVARIFHSKNRGWDWTVTPTPVAAGTQSAGIFSIGFRDATHGMIVGGDYKKPNETVATAAITADRGQTWTLLDRKLPYRSAIAWASDRWVAVGTSGSNSSRDNGATWIELDHNNYNSVAFTSTGEGWAAGPAGRIAKFAK